ncbi:MAG: tetratricopeptide repeat protein [Planctomycetota bacterium]|nr:tetratricopeptide repeat protein [Planctomycetota bacterium]
MFKWSHIIGFVAVVALAVALSMPTRLTRAEMSHDSGRVETSIAIFQEELDRQPDNPQVIIGLSRAMVDDGQSEAAIALLEAQREVFPNNVDILHLLAWQYLEKGEIDKALEVLPPEYQDADFHYACLEHYQILGDLDNAEKHLLLAHPNPDFGVWMEVADMRLNRYDMDGEAEALRRALDLDPGDLTVWERYFLTRVWALDAREVVRAGKIIARQEGGLDRDHLQTLQIAQMSVGDTEGAVDSALHLTLLPDSGPQDAINYAACLRVSGDDDTANRILLRLVEDGDMADWLRGDVLTDLLDTAEGRGDLLLVHRLTGILEKPDEIAEALATIARISIQKGQLENNDLQAILANSDLPDAILEAVIKLVWNGANHDGLTILARDMEQQGLPLEDFVSRNFDSNLDLDGWLRARDENPQAAYAWLGLARTAISNQDTLNASQALDQAWRLLMVDGDSVERLVLLQTMLDFNASLPLGSAEGAKHLEQAGELVRIEAAGDFSNSRWFTPLAAVTTSLLREEQDSLNWWERFAATNPLASQGWREAALRAGDLRDVDSFSRILEHLDQEDWRGSWEEDSQIARMCLELANHYRTIDPERTRALASEGVKRFNAGFPSGQELTPEDYRFLATAYEELGDWTPAAQEWAALTRLEPDDAQAWISLARVSSRLGDQERAWDSLNRATLLLPEEERVERQAAAWEMLSLTSPLDPNGVRRTIPPEREEIALTYAISVLDHEWNEDLAGLVMDRLVSSGRFELAQNMMRGQEGAEVQAVLAEALLERNKPEEALMAARIAVRSTDPGLRLRMAAVFIRLSKFDEAEVVLREVKSGRSGLTLDQYLQLAEAYGAVGDRLNQYAYMDLRAQKGGQVEWLEAVDVRTNYGEGGEAMRVLSEAMEHLALSEGLIERAIRVFSDLGRPGQALEIYQTAVRDDPGILQRLSGETLAEVADASRGLRMPVLAKQLYALSLARDPANKVASMGLARLYLDNGQLQAALAALRAYTEKNADDPWGWLELANTKASNGLSANREYRQVVALTEGKIPDVVQAARASALERLGRINEAQRLLRESMGDKLVAPETASDYAQLLMTAGRYEECEAVLRETIRRFPYFVWAYRLDATSLVRRKRYDLAVERLKQAQRIAPNDGEVRRDLANAYQLWERTWQAEGSWLAAGER